MPIIEVSKLSKSFRTFARREGVLGSVRDLFQRDYKTLKAVDEISFTIDAGELIGYIGPNGAGKSTSIKMLTGILKPTSGSMQVMGFDPFKQRKAYTNHIGVVFGQRTQLWWDIAVIESLKLLGKIYAVKPDQFEERLAILDKILELKPLLHTPVRKLSLGQRIRCDLAASLIHQPPVLFLDEPTVGLDAVGKESVRQFLRHINLEFKTTIILTTHDLDEIEELCKRIIIIDKGKLIYDGELANIRELSGLSKSIVIDFSRNVSAEEMKTIFESRLEFKQENERRLSAKYDPHKLPTVEIIKTVVGKHEVADLTVADPSIEEIVMRIYRQGM